MALLQHMEADVEEVHHIGYGFAVGVGSAEAVEHRIEVAREREELKHMVVAMVHAIEEADAIDHKMAVRVYLEWKDTVLEKLEDTPDFHMTWIQQGDSQSSVRCLCMEDSWP